MTGDKGAPLKPGEKLFTCVLLAIALLMLSQSALLWRQSPGLSGPAAIPLLSSALVSAFLVIAVFRNVKKPTETRRDAPVRERIGQALRTALPRDVIVALLGIAAFCALLACGLSFYLAAPVFLWGMMTWLSRGNALKNLLPAALCTAFVYLVFDLLFRVRMP